MNDQSDHTADLKRQDFEQNWPEYHKRLYPYVLNLTRNEADAKDITQQALLDFKDHMEKNLWQEEIENIGAYLRRIAHNLYIDLCKERGRESVSCDDEQTGPISEISEDPTADIEHKIYIEELYRSLNLKVIFRKLSTEDLELFNLNVVEGLSPTEIAKETGKDVYKIRYVLNRIKATIRARVKSLVKETGGNLFERRN